MRYVQLRAFHAVAQFGGFSRAGDALGLTQPAISDQVRKLEQSYDVLLFSRAKKQVSLTAQGTKLFEITKQMFEIEQQAAELLSQTQAVRTGTLRIVVDSVFHITRILNLFTRNYPGIKVELHSGNSQKVIEMLHDYRADIGVLGAPADQNSLTTVPLGSTQIIAFGSRNIALAGTRTISLKHLTKLPLVMREVGSKTQQKLNACFAGAGLELIPSIVADSREAVHEIVASGEAIGFVSRAEFGRDARVFAMDITGPKKLIAGLAMDEAVVCLKDRRDSKLIHTFMSFAAGIRNISAS